MDLKEWYEKNKENLADWFEKNKDKPVNDVVFDSKQIYAKIESPLDNQWIPETGMHYCYLNAEGEVETNTWHNTALENNRMAIGNVFKTKASAEDAVDRLKVEAELIRLGASREFRLSKDYDDLNYSIFFTTDLKPIVAPCLAPIAGGIYFRSITDAKKAAEQLGYERLQYVIGTDQFRFYQD